MYPLHCSSRLLQSFVCPPAHDSSVRRNEFVCSMHNGPCTVMKLTSPKEICSGPVTCIMVHGSTACHSERRRHVDHSTPESAKNGKSCENPVSLSPSFLLPHISHYQFRAQYQSLALKTCLRCSLLLLSSFSPGRRSSLLRTQLFKTLPPVFSSALELRQLRLLSLLLMSTLPMSVSGPCEMA